MTSSPPTLTGFNNNVRYRGMRFHIQTEDSGITRPHITTQLFADGGYVIKSLRTDYAEYVGHPERAALVQRLMRDQHRAMALDLRDGKLDATIDRIAPPPVEAAPAAAAPEAVAPEAVAPEAAPASSREPSAGAVPERAAPSDAAPAEERATVTVQSGTLVAEGANARRGEPPLPVAEPDPKPPAASDAPASPEPIAASRATARPPSSRKPQSSARPPSSRSNTAQQETNARTPGAKSTPRHRVIPVGDAPASSKTNSSADAANRAASARRSSGSRASGGHAAATQRPPSTQKSPSSRGAAAQQPSSRSGSTQRPASSRSASSQRPPSSRKPARAPSRPKFTAAALSPPSKPIATTRSASSGTNARPPSTRNPPSSARPPSSRGAGSSSKRPPAELVTPPVPSSRRAGRPSPVLTPPKGSKSIFGALPQESLDDAILNFATTVKNGPPTRGSK
jgi:hypothetical protein